MARNTQPPVDSAPPQTWAPTVGDHLVHGLVAIANGPDYCLCGTTWPCARREDRDAQP